MTTPREEDDELDGQSVLVVDDNFFNVDALKEIIEQNFENVMAEGAFSGNSAL